MGESVLKQSSSRARSVAYCGLSIALMCVAAWVTVPFGPVPFTLQTLAVMFVLFALAPQQALIAIAGYLILGGLGLPVFSSFKGGLAALLGPTGGFIVGFFFAGALALLVGYAVRNVALFNSETEKSFFGTKIKAGTLARNLVVGLVFLVILYAFGWAWLSISANMDPMAAFAAAVAPFVVIDLLKMVAAVLLAQAVGAATGALHTR